MRAVAIIGSIIAAFAFFREVTAKSGFLWMSTDEAARLFTQKGRVDVAFAGFRTDVGRYPTNEEGFTSLIHAPAGTEQHWHGPYIEGGRVPLDPWGHPYQYHTPATKNTRPYDIWSFGPDGVLSADDIGSWSN